MADNSSYFTAEQNRLTAEANLKAKEMGFCSLAFGFHAKAYEKASGAPAGDKKARKAKQIAQRGMQAAADQAKPKKSAVQALQEVGQQQALQNAIFSKDGAPILINHPKAKLQLQGPAGVQLQGYISGTCCTANADGSGNPERIIFTVEQQEEYNDKNPPWPQRPKRCDTCRQAKNAAVLANNAVVAAAAPGLGLGVNPPSPTWTIIPASSNSRHPDQIYIESAQVVRVCLFLNTASSVAASLFLFAFWRKNILIKPRRRQKLR